MCLPIFPAVDHPSGRAPLRPEPAFPFMNCYHWCGMDVKLRIKNGQFTRDMSKLVWLSDRYQAIFHDVDGKDRCAMYFDRMRRAASLVESRQNEPAAVDPAPESVNVVTTVPANTRQTHASIDDSSSLHSYGPRSSDWESEGEDDGDFLDIDPFGLDDDGTCYPVVELSTDLPGELTQDDIPDALEFAKQHQALSAYAMNFLSVVL